MWKKYKSYIISILISLAVGGLAALLTMGNMDIYKNLEQPALSPPGILFPIVWSVLYILMGISAAMVYEKRESSPSLAKEGLYLYASNLVLNFAWSIIFFNFNAFLLSFIWLLLLLFTIIRMIMVFYKVDKVAGYLQIPYVIWVAFAGYLNFGIWLLNR